jgi:hypothetical protein
MIRKKVGTGFSGKIMLKQPAKFAKLIRPSRLNYAARRRMRSRR